MPITQTRLANVANIGQELLTQLTAIRTTARNLELPSRVPNYNAAIDHIADPRAKEEMQSMLMALLVLYNKIVETEIDPLASIVLAQETAHYKVTKRQNDRQAAYQRRKRLTQEQFSTEVNERVERMVQNKAAPLPKVYQDYLDGKTNTLPPAEEISERAPLASILTPSKVAALVPSKLPDGPREAPLAFDTRGKDVL